MTLKVAVRPAITVWLSGCEVIVGAPAAALTVNVAALLVRVPTEFVTVTVKIDPSSVAATAAVV